MSRIRLLSWVFFLFAASALQALDEVEERLAHECGVALIRLKHPLSYYEERYGDAAWGTKKLLALMEKQRNRGQDGAGIAIIKLDMPLGKEYLHQLRFAGDNAVDKVFQEVGNDLQYVTSLSAEEHKLHSAYSGELLLGHLRYATQAGLHTKLCQPFVRANAAASRHFALAGNFNMTNTPDLSAQLEKWGLFPTSDSDTQVVLDTIAYQLDKEYDRAANTVAVMEIQDEGRKWAEAVSEQIDLPRVLAKAAQKWDGGYVFCGIVGSGESFVCRDPAGIRPGYYFENEELVAVASERIALVDVFNVSLQDVRSLPPGHTAIVSREGKLTFHPFKEALKHRECLFERIYFSKANDPQIYEERKSLGRMLAPRVFSALQEDLENAIFTYVPNSSLPAFHGLVEEVAHLARQKAADKIISDLAEGKDVAAEVLHLASIQARSEFLIAKNQRIRTFISCDKMRKSLVAQLYEVTQGIVTPETTLVVVDDSIVRGTTLKEALVRKLANMNPKKIVFVSSAPPVMYPDCYGIDMSQLGRFVAFQACSELLKEKGEVGLCEGVQARCQYVLETGAQENPVKALYDRFSLEELSEKIAALITPENLGWKGKVEVIYQNLDGLHQAIPGHTGDWVFSGDYPTLGGYQVASRGFLKWMKGDDSRSY